MRACICVERKCVRAIESKRKRWSHRLMEQREIFCHCLNMTNSSEAVATASMSQKKFPLLLLCSIFGKLETNSGAVQRPLKP